MPWGVEELCKAGGGVSKFYEASEFSVKNDLFGKRVQLKFPR